MSKIRGENFHPCLTEAGFGDSLLALFDRFFQGISEEHLRGSFRQILLEARQNHDDGLIINLFVMTFHTRWCRGGKGAKLPFFRSLKILYEEFPAAVIKLLPLVPEYGYWKDLLLLLEDVTSHPIQKIDYQPLYQGVWDTFASQLMVDHENLLLSTETGKKPSLSFAAKYAPRHKNKFDRMFDAVSHISRAMFANEEKRNRKHLYRTAVSALTKALDVPEIKMCSKQFSEIRISSAPSRFVHLRGAALANELLKKQPEAHQLATGNRHPDDGDRVQCRENLISALQKGNVKGGQLYPHEFVEKVFGGKANSLSAVAKLTLNAQWVSMRESVSKMIRERAVAAASACSLVASSPNTASAPTAPILGNIIPLCDVSGSMTGTPMMVSIGLGMLLSELANESFRDLVLTFSSDPKWFDLSQQSTMIEKVNYLQRAPWGMSTDLYKALDKIAVVVRSNRLRQEDIPNLLVISDMQFNAAASCRNNWNTAHENAVELFHDLGMSISGQPYSPPVIIYWNVRGSIGFPVASEQPGVVLLSGYSPSLMKFLLSGELESEVVDTQGNKSRKLDVTPQKVLQKVLTDKGLDSVREKLVELAASGDLDVHSDHSTLLGGPCAPPPPLPTQRSRMCVVNGQYRPSVYPHHHRVHMGMRGKSLALEEAYEDKQGLWYKSGRKGKLVRHGEYSSLPFGRKRDREQMEKKHRAEKRKSRKLVRKGQFRSSHENYSVPPSLVDGGVYYF